VVLDGGPMADRTEAIAAAVEVTGARVARFASVEISASVPRSRGSSPTRAAGSAARATARTTPAVRPAAG
jgi:hypothetical protein